MTFTPGDPNHPTVPVFDFLLGSEPVQGSSHGTGAPQRPRGKRRAPRVDHRSVAVPVVVILLVLLLLGGGVYAGWTLVQQSEAQVKADSASFCAAIAETPGVLEQPGFGWPTGGADLPGTLELMKGYQVRWEGIAAAAPPSIQADLDAVAKAATIITSGIEASKSIDRPATLATMQGVTSSTDIPAWANKYCG